MLRVLPEVAARVGGNAGLVKAVGATAARCIHGSATSRTGKADDTVHGESTRTFFDFLHGKNSPVARNYGDFVEAQRLRSLGGPDGVKSKQGVHSTRFPGLVAACCESLRPLEYIAAQIPGTLRAETAGLLHQTGRRLMTAAQMAHLIHSCNLSKSNMTQTASPHDASAHINHVAIRLVNLDGNVNDMKESYAAFAASQGLRLAQEICFNTKMSARVFVPSAQADLVTRDEIGCAQFTTFVDISGIPLSKTARAGFEAALRFEPLSDAHKAAVLKANVPQPAKDAVLLTGLGAPNHLAHEVHGNGTFDTMVDLLKRCGIRLNAVQHFPAAADASRGGLKQVSDFTGSIIRLAGAFVEMTQLDRVDPNIVRYWISHSNGLTLSPDAVEAYKDGRTVVMPASFSAAAAAVLYKSTEIKG